METRRGQFCGSFLVGSSVRNQRIEWNNLEEVDICHFDISKTKCHTFVHGKIMFFS